MSLQTEVTHSAEVMGTHLKVISFVLDITHQLTKFTFSAGKKCIVKTQTLFWRLQVEVITITHQHKDHW